MCAPEQFDIPDDTNDLDGEPLSWGDVSTWLLAFAIFCGCLGCVGSAVVAIWMHFH